MKPDDPSEYEIRFVGRVSKLFSQNQIYSESMIIIGDVESVSLGKHYNVNPEDFDEAESDSPEFNLSLVMW